MTTRWLAAMALLFAVFSLLVPVSQGARAQAAVQRPCPAGTVGVRTALGPFPSDVAGTVIDFGEISPASSSYILPLAFQGCVTFDTQWQMTLKALSDFIEVDPGERTPRRLPVGRLKWRLHGVGGGAWTPVTLTDALVAEGQAGAMTLIPLDFCMEVQPDDPPGHYCAELVFTVTPTLDLAVSRADPNPFSPGSSSLGVKDVTNIYYETSGGELAVRIYDSVGNLVDTVLDFRLHEPGWHFVTWDGRSSSGAVVKQGQYYYHIVRRAQSGEEEIAAKGLIKVDITVPHLLLSQPANGERVANNVRVSGRSDPEAVVYVAYDGDMNEVCARLVADGAGAFAATVPAKAGPFVLWVIAEDHAGNRKATSVQLNGQAIDFTTPPFTTDRQAAAVEGIAPPNSEVVVSVNGRPVAVCRADPSGRFETSQVPLTQGRNLVTASSTMVDGFTVSTPKPLVIWRRDATPDLTRSISGMVIDAKDGMPVRGARVDLIILGEGLDDVFGSSRAEVYTPASGEFRFAGLSDGAYLIEVEAPGYVGRQHGPLVVDGEASVDPVTIELVPGTALGIKKTVDRTCTEVGDVITYSINITNAGGEDIGGVVVQDHLPEGMSLIAGSGRLDGNPMEDPAWNGERGAWEWRVGILPAFETVQLTYEAAVGIGCQKGEAVSRAVAYGRNSTGDVVAAGPAQVVVHVTEGPFGQDGIILGRVFADVDGDGAFGPGDWPLGAVRAVMENGLAVYTDDLGRFMVPGVAPGFHVIGVAGDDIPAGYRLSRSSQTPIKVSSGMPTFVALALEPDTEGGEDAGDLIVLAQGEVGAALSHSGGARHDPYAAAGLTLWYSGQPLAGWTIEAGLDFAGSRGGAASALPSLAIPASRTTELPYAGPLYFSAERQGASLTYGMVRTGFGHPASCSAYDRVLPQFQARFAGEKGELVLFDAAAAHVPAWEEYALEMGRRSFRLSKTPVIPGSEAVRMAVKDRQDPSLTLFTRELTAGQDYVLDYESGRLTLLGEHGWADYGGLPFLVVSYEFAPPARDLEYHIAGARAVWAPDDGTQIAAHVVRESRSPEPLYLAGIAGKYKTEVMEVSGEYAVSSRRPGSGGEDPAEAANLSIGFEVAPWLNLSGHYEMIAPGFVNPVRGSEDGVVRYGLRCEAAAGYGLTLMGGVDVANTQDAGSQDVRRKIQWFVSGSDTVMRGLTSSARLNFGTEADATTGERLSSSFGTAVDLGWSPGGPVDFKASWMSTTTSDASGRTVSRNDSVAVRVDLAPRESLRTSVQYIWRPEHGLDNGILKLGAAFSPMGEHSISFSCTLGPERGSGAVSISAAGTLWDSLTFAAQYDRVSEATEASRRLELSAAYRPGGSAENRRIAVFGGLSLTEEAGAGRADGSPRTRVEGSLMGVFKPLDGLELSGRYATKALAGVLGPEGQPLTTRVLGLAAVHRFSDRWDITGGAVFYLQDELDRRKQEYTLELGWAAASGLRLAVGCKTTINQAQDAGFPGCCETGFYLALGLGLMYGL